MDPKILQLMQQGQQGGGQGQEFNADQNPFEGILASMQGGQGAPQAQAEPQAPQQMPQGQMVAPGQQPMESQLEKGKNPSATKFLTQAIQAIQNYINASTDKDTIMLGRNIVKLLSKLIDQEEDGQLGNLDKGY